MMRAWRSDGGGRLWVDQVDVPGPRRGEILVKVENAGLNFADRLMVEGRYQVRPDTPFTPGFELCGTVVENASDRPLMEGTRVAAQIPFGAFAEYAAFDAQRVIATSGLSPDSAAAMPVAYTTALLALKTGGVARGSYVAVSAASGGVGLATLQLGSLLEARMLAIVGDPAKGDLARINGAEAVISHRDPNWQAALITAADGLGPSVAIDMVGGVITHALLRSLRWRGRLLMVGFAGGTAADLPANRMLVKAVTAAGIFWDFEKDRTLIRSIWDELERAIETGRIAPVVSNIVAFDDLPNAIERLVSGKTVGKLVLRIG